MLIETGPLLHDRARHLLRCLVNCELPCEKIDFQACMSMPTETLTTHLLTKLGPAIAGVTVLNHDHVHGVFNRHDEPHVKAVYSLAQRLLDKKKTPVDLETRNVAAITTCTHDLGNNLSRHNHGCTGARLLKDIFTNFDPVHDSLALSVLIGVWAHDEKNGTTIDDFAHIADYAEIIVAATRKKPLTEEEQTALRQTARQIKVDGVLAVVAADKLDVGRHRLTEAFLDPTRSQAEIEEDLDTNSHTQLCAYARVVKNRFLDAATFEQQITVAANLKDEHDPDILAILKRYRYDPERSSSIHTPKWWGESWRQRSSSYASSYFATYQRTYWDRIAMLNSCLFAMFPDLQNVRVSVVYAKPGMAVTTIQDYFRENWQFAVFMVWKAIKNFRFKKDLSTDRKLVPAILRPAIGVFRQDRAENVSS